MPEIDPNQELRVYVEYLKIPEDQCPPNYYSLLAIPKTIHDASTIDNAAKRRSEALRRGLPADLHPAGRKILKQIARSRICLLDAGARAAYDASIGLRTGVDPAGKTKEAIVDAAKSTKGAPRDPANQARTAASRSSNAGTARKGGKSVPSSTPGTPSPPPVGSPPIQEGPPHIIEDFDDLLSELPDVEPISSKPAAIPTRIHARPAASKPKKLSNAIIVAIAVAGCVVILGIGAVLFFSSSQDGGNIAESHEEAANTGETSQSSKEPVETDSGLSYQASIPKLPPAKRVNNDTTKAEYSISDGILSVSIGMPIPVGGAIPVFVQANEHAPVNFKNLRLRFNEAAQEAGYFNVKGRAVQPHLFVDNADVLEIRQEIIKYLSPGEANLVIHFDGQEIRLPFQVTRIDLPENFGKKELIELLGFPVRKETKYAAMPDYYIRAMEIYEVRVGHGGGNLEHWYYGEYPTLAFVPDRSLIWHDIPKPMNTVDQAPPKPHEISSLLANSVRPQATRATKTKPPEPRLPPPEPLLTEVTLPALRGSESTLSDEVKAPVDLGPTGSFELDGLRLTLDHPLTKEDGNNVKFEISRSSESKEKPIWEISLRSAPKEEKDEKSVLDDVGAGLNELVGTIYLEDSHLKFAWTPSKHMSFANQLRNCVLCLESGTKSHRISLQSCTRIKPILVDFDETSQVIDLEQESLPPLDTLFFEVTSLENFDVAVEQQPSDGMIPFGDTLRLKLTSWKKPAEFRIKFGGSRKKPSVVLASYYQLDRKWQRMTIEEVDSAIRGLQRSLGRSKADLREGESALSRLPSQIDSAARKLRSSDGQNAAILKSQLLTLQRQLSKAKGMVRRASKLIPELEAKTPLLKELGALGNRLHEKARIQLHVFVKTENGNCDLLRTTDDTREASDEEPSNND